jgi:hypothetical protein
MKSLQLSMLLSLVLVSTIEAADVDFPKSPVNLKEAETQGLHRMSGEELKPLFPGTMDVRQYNGEERRTVTKADGSLETTFITMPRIYTGKWRIDEQNNTYCAVRRMAFITSATTSRQGSLEVFGVAPLTNDLPMLR